MTPESSHNEFLEALRRFDELRQTLMGFQPVQEAEGAYGLRLAEFRRAQALVEPAFRACEDVSGYAYGYYAATGSCFLQVPRELRESLRDALTNLHRWDELRILADFAPSPGVTLGDDEIISLAEDPSGPDYEFPSLPLTQIFRAPGGPAD